MARPPVLPDGFLYSNGQIEATEISVSAEIAGKVLESNLIEGRAVNAGDVLVRLDETDLRLRLAQAEAQVQAAASTLAQVEQPLTTWRHHLDAAVADLKRYRTLSETGTVSAQAMERAQNQEKEARGQVGALQAQQAQSEALLHEGRLIACDTPRTLRAALPGRMLEIEAHPQRRALAALQRNLPHSAPYVFGEFTRAPFSEFSHRRDSHDEPNIGKWGKVPTDK